MVKAIVMGEYISSGMGKMISALIAYVILCSCFCDGSPDIQSKTYPHTLDNGDKVTCFKCTPGHYFKEDCSTDGGKARCEPCKEGTFNSDYTVAVSCAPCSRQCQTPNREFIAKNCTSVSNISCLCREGLYRDPVDYGLCLAINPCPPGQGVVTEGYGLADTVCEDCPAGYFSAKTSKTEACQECSICALGTVVDKDCTRTSDRTCKSPDADEFSTEAVVGIIVGGMMVVAIVIILVCCFCVMRTRCAVVRKQLCKCCHRPYEECTQHDKSMKNGSANLSDIKVDIRNGSNQPDVILDTRERPVSVPDIVLYQLQEDLISQEYPQFFRFLFTNDADTHINEMKLNYNLHGVKEIIYKILVRWRDIEKENAKPEKILTALREWNRYDLVQKYAEIFGVDTSETGNMNRHRNISKSSVSTEV